MYTKPPNSAYAYKHRDKRDRNIGRKAVLSNVKTALTCTPALELTERSIGKRKKHWLRK